MTPAFYKRFHRVARLLELYLQPRGLRFELDVLLRAAAST